MTLSETAALLKASRAINFNAEPIFQLAHTAITRAYVFAGYGINGINNLGIGYDLDGNPTDGEIFKSYKFIELSEDEEDTSRILFRQWIIGNAIAEYIHITSIFADQLYSQILSIEWLINGKNYDDLLKKEQHFHKLTSLNDKLKRIKKEFDISSEMYEYISSLNKARHCIVHSGGYVVDQHLNRHDGLELKWRRMAMFLQHNDGEFTEIIGPTETKEGGTVAIKFVEKNIIFKKGDVIDISLNDFRDLLFFAHMDLNNMRKSRDGFLDRIAESKGVKKTQDEDGRSHWSFAERLSSLPK